LTSPDPQTTDAEATRLPDLNLSELHRRMARLVQQSPEEAGSLRAFLELVASLVNAGAAVFFSAGQQALEEKDGIYSRQALAWSTDLKSEIRTCAAGAVKRNASGFTRLSRFPQAMVISAPVCSDRDADGCLCVVVLTADQAVAPFLAIVQLLGAYLGLWRRTGRDPQPENREDVTVRLATLMARLMAQDDRRQAELVLVNDLKAALGCETVMLATAARGRSLRLAAVSDLTAVDTRAEYAAAARSVFDECVLQQAVLCWPEKVAPDSIASPICGRLVGILNARSGVCLPLTDTAGRLWGACLFVWSEKPDSRIFTSRVMSTAAEMLAGGLAALTRRVGRRWKPVGIGGAGEQYRRIFFAVLLAAALTGIALVPVTYQVKATCSVTPVVTRVVSAPFDGILEAVLQKPGTVVKAGESLARMDGRVIDLELRTLSAELQKARKMRDVHLASGNTAAAQIAVLESERLEQKIKLQQRRRQQLDIVSPIDGIVLTGRLEHVEGSPVRKGQFLFEISPLKNMLVEVAILQEDISYVQPGMPVRVVFDAYPHRRWESAIQAVLPRSEVREGRSVFVGQVAFANPEGRLRPGMRGRAAIATRPRSLLWIYFHRPWYALLAATAL